MHELSIAMSMIEMASEEAQRHESRVLALHLKLGPLSGVVPEALVSAFELAREGTELSDCRLVFEEVPITVFCATCQAERTVESLQSMCCNECGTPSAELVHGRELELTALELEQ